MAGSILAIYVGVMRSRFPRTELGMRVKTDTSDDVKGIIQSIWYWYTVTDSHFHSWNHISFHLNSGYNMCSNTQLPFSLKLPYLWRNISFLSRPNFHMWSTFVFYSSSMWSDFSFHSGQASLWRSYTFHPGLSYHIWNNISVHSSEASIWGCFSIHWPIEAQDGMCRVLLAFI